MHPHVKKHEALFKSTYMKPTHIYKYIFERQQSRPLFLQRTLSYVSKHRDRHVVQRETKINSIAKRLASQKIKKKTNKELTIFTKSESESNGGSSKTGNTSEIACFFNWICDDPDKTSQKSRSHAFVCPWCRYDLHYLDTLMIHLKCSHPRFNFHLVEEEMFGHVINVSLNKSFDGSYRGFKYPGHDLKRDFKFTFDTPKRRTPQTKIIHFKSKRNLNFLRQHSNYDGYFTAPDDDIDVDVCSGRLYYHTSTCLPIKSNEGDIDSEADMDPDWLKERTQLMIDEFTDVNEGEKEILKLWNLHIMSNHRYRSDNMIREACLDFVDQEGYKIQSKNLVKNFLLHLVNLFDFGLIGSGDILECIRKIKTKRPTASCSPNKSAVKFKLDRNSNEHCHHSPPTKRAFLYPR